MSKWLLVFLLHFVFCLTSVAQDEWSVDSIQVKKHVTSKLDKKIKADSLLNVPKYHTNNSRVERHFLSDFQQKYQGNEFDYHKTKPRLSLWDRIKLWMRDLFSFEFIDKTSAWTFYLIYTFLGVLFAGGGR